MPAHGIDRARILRRLGSVNPGYHVAIAVGAMTLRLMAINNGQATIKSGCS